MSSIKVQMKTSGESSLEQNQVHDIRLGEAITNSFFIQNVVAIEYFFVLFFLRNSFD